VPLIESLEDRRLLSTVSLGFGGGSGGVADTGFTSDSNLVSSNLKLSNGQLLVTTTAGDLTRNNQDNALTLGLNGTTNFTLQTRMRSLNFKANWQNAGIFVGTSQDNYVKLVVGYNNGTILQLGGESNAAFTTAKQSAFSFSGITTLDLRLVGTASSKTLVAQYRVNSDSDSAWVTFGQMTNANVFSTAARAGIVSTNLGTSSTVVDYDSFSVTDGSTTPPPPPPPPTGTLTVGANVNATKQGGNQVETEIAINPTNPNNVVIVGVDSNNNGSALVISRSFDGGKTWTRSSLGSAQDKLSGSTPRVDPHLTFDRFGNLYVVYEVAASSTEIRVIVARSSDGGQSFAASTAVGGQGLSIDYPIIATGPDATDLNRETAWVGYTDTKAKRVRVVAARSTGLGNLSGFTAPTTVSDASGSYGSIAVGPAGQVVMAWQTNTGGQGPSKIMLDVDPDGLGTAKTWGTDRYAADTNVGGFDYIPAQPNRSIDAGVGLAFDRSTSSSTRGRLYMVYTDENGNESNDTNILLRYSDNLGTNWGSPLKVNDDNTTRSQFLPAISVDPSTGNVAIVWRDARNSSGNNTAELWGTVSVNHGVSVRPNVRISAGISSQSAANGVGSDYDFGDYEGVAFANGKFIAVWADNSNSTRDNPNGATLFDLYTAVVTVN
jgi:regulation of enolase protein 1 (concanavalin A-like superfamily)